MDLSSRSAGYSSDVKLWLEHAAGRVALAQTGPDFVIPAAPAELDPGPATVVMAIDGREHRRSVTLSGESGPGRRVAIQEASSAVA